MKRVSANYHDKVDWLNILLVIPFPYKSFMRVQSTNKNSGTNKGQVQLSKTSKAKEVYLQSYLTESYNSLIWK